MDKEKLRYRMYGLVPYNISPIQQGIQYGHAVVEYMLEHVLEKIMNGDELDLKVIKPLYEWSKNDKTFIILNGGTTNKEIPNIGTLNQHTSKLVYDFKVPVGIFFEPDLGDQLTATVFLVDERVWDKKKYPDLIEIPDWQTDEVAIRMAEKANSKRIEVMGGQVVWEFRQFLNQFKLA